MITHRAEIEYLAGLIRVYVEPHRGRPDPYEYVATLRWVNPFRVEIMGVTRAPNRHEILAMARALVAAGITSAFWIRKEGDVDREFEVPGLERLARIARVRS